MYLIDGYNLLYQTDYNDRDELISALDKWANFYAKKVKVVFDGHSPIDVSTFCVQVVFTGDADAGILEFINLSPNDMVLVTSDKEVIAEAKILGVQKVIKSEDFDFNIKRKAKVTTDESPDFFMTDSDVEQQLKEFNNFKSGK